MKKCLFNLVTIVSLLLCVVVSVIWVRSYSIGDRLQWAGTGKNSGCETQTFIQVASGLGCISLFRDYEEWYGTVPEKYTAGFRLRRFLPLDNHFAARFGFCYRRRHDEDRSGRGIYGVVFDRRVVQVPFWFVLLITGVLPLMWCVRTWRRRRASTNGFPVGIVEVGKEMAYTTHVMTTISGEQ